MQEIQWMPDIMEKHVKKLTIIIKYNIYKCFFFYFSVALALFFFSSFFF